MRGYPQFSFWISIAPDMIYLSHIVIIWEKILPISEHRPKVLFNSTDVTMKQLNHSVLQKCFQLIKTSECEMRELFIHSSLLFVCFVLLCFCYVVVWQRYCCYVLIHANSLEIS